MQKLILFILMVWCPFIVFNHDFCCTLCALIKYHAACWLMNKILMHDAVICDIWEQLLTIRRTCILLIQSVCTGYRFTFLMLGWWGLIYRTILVRLRTTGSRNLSWLELQLLVRFQAYELTKVDSHGQFLSFLASIIPL